MLILIDFLRHIRNSFFIVTNILNVKGNWLAKKNWISLVLMKVMLLSLLSRALLINLPQKDRRVGSINTLITQFPFLH